MRKIFVLLLAAIVVGSFSERSVFGGESDNVIYTALFLGT